MIKPYIFTACEKAIIAKDDVASLIALFTKITVNVPEGTEIPKNAVAPKEWAIFSMWNHEPGDEKRTCFLCAEIRYPDNTHFADLPRLRMVLEAGKKSQLGIQVQGFPIGQGGPIIVRTWVEEGEQTIAGPIELSIDVEVKITPSAQKELAVETNKETRTTS